MCVCVCVSCCVLQPEKQDNLEKQLNAMRWVLLGFIFIELMTLVLACLLKWVIKVS